MTDPATVSDSVLDRYLAGDASASETREVETWLAAEPARYRAIQLLRGDLRGTWDTNEAWRRLNERIVEHIMGIERNRPRRSWLAAPLSVALIVLILAVVAWLVIRRG